MKPKNRVPTHPGEVLREEFLAPMRITQVAFAAHIGVPLQRVNEIVRGRRGVTAETAWRDIRIPFTAFAPYRTGSALDLSRLERIGLVAIGREFAADLCLAELRFY